MNSHNNGRVTMRMLAEQLGVTKTTVSLALRDNPSISKETRERVVKLARELNYRPDPAISAIAASRWNNGCPDRHRVIVFLCHARASFRPYQEGYLAAAQERAAEFGYKVEPFLVDEYPTAAAITRVLQARGIRGILIPQIPNPDSTRVMNIDWNKFTAVCCGIGRVRPPLHTVSDNMLVNTRKLWELAYKAGFRRIGAAVHLHDPVAEDDWNRLGASYAAQEILGIPHADRIPPMTGGFYDDEVIYEWYRKYQPDLIIGFNQDTGESLKRKGVRFPQDAEFLSLMTEPESPWSGFVRPLPLVAQNAVDLLVTEIRENQWGLPALPRFTLVSPEWNLGSTFTRWDPVTSPATLAASRSTPALSATPAAIPHSSLPVA